MKHLFVYRSWEDGDQPDEAKTGLVVATDANDAAYVACRHMDINEASDFGPFCVATLAQDQRLLDHVEAAGGLIELA